MVSWKLCLSSSCHVTTLDTDSFLQGGPKFSLCSSCCWRAALDPGHGGERTRVCHHSVWCGSVQTTCLFKRRKSTGTPCFLSSSQSTNRVKNKGNSLRFGSSYKHFGKLQRLFCCLCNEQQGLYSFAGVFSIILFFSRTCTQTHLRKRRRSGSSKVAALAVHGLSPAREGCWRLITELPASWPPHPTAPWRPGAWRLLNSRKDIFVI